LRKSDSALFTVSLVAPTSCASSSWVRLCVGCFYYIPRID
jgi:hypothetical protein